MVVSVIWIVATFLLVTLRKGCWKACFVSLVLLSGIGIAVCDTGFRWGMYAEERPNSDHPVAMALFGCAFYLVPFAVLLWNLSIMRRMAQAGYELDE